MKIKLRCQALDCDGKRCKNIAKHIENYHGDKEIYDYNFENPDKDITWVEIGVCDKHLKVNKDSENYAGKINPEKFVISVNSDQEVKK